MRTRKKKFVSEAPPPRVSEFVELSTSDIIVEEADGEIRVVQKVPNAELEEQRNKPETGQRYSIITVIIIHTSIWADTRII